MCETFVFNSNVCKNAASSLSGPEAALHIPSSSECVSENLIYFLVYCINSIRFSSSIMQSHLFLAMEVLILRKWRTSFSWVGRITWSAPRTTLWHTQMVAGVQGEDRSGSMLTTRIWGPMRLLMPSMLEGLPQNSYFPL